MAFCTNCGSPLPPDSRFCTNCGAASAPANTKTQDSDFSGAGSAPNTNAYNPPVGNPHTPPVPGCNPAFAARLRAFLLTNDSLLLALIALLAVNALLTFIGSVRIDVGSAATGLILPALFVTGLDMIRQQRSKVGDFPTAGFTILQVVTIIQAVAMFIIAVAAFVVMVSGEKNLSFLGRFVDTASIKSVLVVVCFILMAVFAFMGVVFVFMANSCASFKKYLYTGIMPKISGFVVGSLWTFGVLAAIGSFSSLGSIDDAPLNSILSFLSGLCSAGSYIVGAMIASKAKQSFLY